MTTVVVQTFVIEPIWNSESVVASTRVSRLSSPEAAASTWPSRRTASDAPGTPCAARASSRSCWRDVLVVASDMDSLLWSGVGLGLAGRLGEMAEGTMRALVGALARVALHAHPALGSRARPDRAPRMEVAPGRRVVRVGRVAQLQVGRDLAAQRRNRIEQSPRIRMLGRR